MVNWVRCRCDKYLAHSWGIVQKMRYASFIEMYEGKSHKRKRFAFSFVVLGHLYTTLSLRRIFFCCCFCLWATDKNAHHTLCVLSLISSQNIVGIQSIKCRSSGGICFIYFSVCSAQKQQTFSQLWFRMMCDLFFYCMNLHEFLFYCTSNSSLPTFLFVRISLKYTRTHMNQLVRLLKKTQVESCA